MTDPMLPQDHTPADAPDDAQLQALLRTAREHYNVPSTMPDFAAMWKRVERDTFGDDADDTGHGVLPIHGGRSRGSAWFRRAGTWGALAAGLVLGVMGGRATVRPEAPVAVTAEAPAAPAGTVDMATARYLGQTAALLVSLPAEPRGNVIDANFADRAQQLLSTTRLLLDAATEPETRALLEDLELVLAQIVGIQSGDRREELELINQALEQRELLPRLHSAVNANSLNAD